MWYNSTSDTSFDTGITAKSVGYTFGADYILDIPERNADLFPGQVATELELFLWFFQIGQHHFLHNLPVTKILFFSTHSTDPTSIFFANFKSRVLHFIVHPSWWQDYCNGPGSLKLKYHRMLIRRSMDRKTANIMWS